MDTLHLPVFELMFSVVKQFYLYILAKFEDPLVTSVLHERVVIRVTDHFCFFRESPIPKEAFSPGEKSCAIVRSSKRFACNI